MKKLMRFLCVFLCLLLGAAAAACDSGTPETEISIFKWDFAALNAARRQNTPIYQALKEANGGLDLKSVTCGYADWESTISTTRPICRTYSSTMRSTGPSSFRR